MGWALAFWDWSISPSEPTMPSTICASLELSIISFCILLLSIIRSKQMVCYVARYVTQCKWSGRAVKDQNMYLHNYLVVAG